MTVAVLPLSMCLTVAFVLLSDYLIIWFLASIEIIKPFCEEGT